MLPKYQAEFLKICSLQAYFRAKPRPDPALVTNIKHIYDRDIFIGAKYNNQKIFVSHKLETQCQFIVIFVAPSQTNKNFCLMT